MNSRVGDLAKHPEAAYLTDLRAYGADADWKKIRTAKAKSALSVLNKI